MRRKKRGVEKQNGEKPLTLWFFWGRVKGIWFSFFQSQCSSLVRKWLVFLSLPRLSLPLSAPLFLGYPPLCFSRLTGANEEEMSNKKKFGKVKALKYYIFLPNISKIFTIKLITPNDSLKVFWIFHLIQYDFEEIKTDFKNSYLKLIFGLFQLLI